jgi:hypothetical protein
MAHDVEPDELVNWSVDEYVVDGVERVVVKCINEVTGDRKRNVLRPDDASRFDSVVSEWSGKSGVVHVGLEVTEFSGITDCHVSLYAEKDDGEVVEDIETFYFYC